MLIFSVGLLLAILYKPGICVIIANRLRGLGCYNLQLHLHSYALANACSCPGLDGVLLISMGILMLCFAASWSVLDLYYMHHCFGFVDGRAYRVR